MKNIAKRLYVIGAGGHAKVVIATLNAMGLNIDRVLDDNRALWGRHIMGIDIGGPILSIQETEETITAIIAIGENNIRKKIAESLPRVEWINAIHPSAFIHPSAKIGTGNMIFAGTVIQPDTQLGNHCIINTAASIDHDCIIEDYVHIAPGCHLAGSVSINEGTFLGIGSNVIPGVTIGKWSICGAGSAITNDIPDKSKFAGVPARQIGNN